MKTFRILSVMLVSLTFILGSCNKYAEGPSISLRTKKARVANTWEVDMYVTEDGTEVDDNSGTTTTYSKDGTVTYSVGGASFSGTWEFNGDKTGINVTTQAFGFSGTQEFIIIKLENDEMWLAVEDDYDESEDNYGGYTVYVSAD